MESSEPPAPLVPGTKTYLALIGALSLIGAVPLCWWCADQRITPWGDEARWMSLQETTDAAAFSVADEAYVELECQRAPHADRHRREDRGSRGLARVDATHRGTRAGLRQAGPAGG
jgi:hypothetical protein